MVDARVGGERRRRVVETREAADALLERWQAEGADAGPTLEEVAAEYLLHQEASLRPASVAAMRETLAALRRASPELFARPAMSMTPADARRLKVGLARGRAVATVAKDLSRLRAMLNWAARPAEGEGRREGGGLLPRVPVYIRPPRVPKPSPATVAPRLVDDADVLALLRRARDPRLRFALALARYCGLRRSEVIRLELGDLDIDGGAVRVLGPTKGHRARLAPLGPRGLEEARIYLARHPVPPGQRTPRLPLFPGRRGRGHWTASALTQQVRRLARRANWATAKPGLHSLRATWCTDLLGRGVPLPDAQEAGGWASLAALQHYAGAAPRALERLARHC
jgi:integrase/recombinase XerD